MARVATTLLLVLLAGISSKTSAVQLSVSPIEKVMQLLSGLEVKVNKDSQAEQKAFDDYVDWCQNGEKDKGFEITTAKSEIEDLTATIGKAASDIETSDSKVQSLAESIATNDADLKAATGIRDKENSEFVATEKELSEAIDTLERAVNVLQRKMRGSAMLQQKVTGKDVGQMIHTLSAIIDAAALSLHDKQMLLGLVQNNAGSDEDEDSLGAPAAEAYQSKSGNIVDVLEDLKQKAVSELEQARREETNARHNFELAKQSLEDGIAADTKDLSEAKTMKHSSAETKANAEGELSLTSKELEESQHVLSTMKSQCKQAATDHETSVKDRAEELEAIAMAKKAISEMTGGAEAVVYGSASFLQLSGGETSGSSLQTRADLANFEVVNLVRKLARQSKSAALAQLASRISTAMREGGEDPFAKVKAMITDMIGKLESEAGEDATHKAYCDKEMGDSQAKIDELKFDLEKLSSKIDKAKSEATTLKNEVATLQSEMAAIAKSQGSADEYRREEHGVYVTDKADLEQGLKGVRVALQVLRDYYANQADASLVQEQAAPDTHSKASGAGGGIIGMLEVIESDLGKALADKEMAEMTAATAYERVSQENKISKSMKEKDVEYKSKAATSNDKSVLELGSDRDSAQNELDAVLQYSANIRQQCVAKPETYGDKKAAREAEIAGLREALEILAGEASLIQHGRHAA